jgi:hypothetical protein
MEKINGTDNEQRDNKRIEVAGVVFISGIDEKGSLVGQDIGVVKNISKSGIMMELYNEIDYETVELTGSALDGTQIEIKGKVVYLKRLNDNNICVGIQFTGSELENIRFVKEIVKNYHYKNAKTKIKAHGDSR